MAKNTFDAILTSVPASASAARVTARGEHWTPEGEIPPGLRHWKSPPPLRSFADTFGNSPGAIDLTGKKFGRFTVIGLAVETAKDGARWVCRCVCGDYEARSAKTIKAALAGLSQPDTLSFRCFYCHSWETTKNRYKKKGAKPLSSFIEAGPRVVQLKGPDAIIADRLAQTIEREDGCIKLAVDLIAALNKRGYRIVRGEKSGILDAPEAQAFIHEEK